MSLYNMINGVNPATFFILPMLGKHPEEYPRFRDCFIGDDDAKEYKNCIMVYTRVGGDNREAYAEQLEEMYAHPNFVGDFDDDFDSTYATYVFSVPDEWRSDFDAIMLGQIEKISPEYQTQLRKVFPKLNDKFDLLFNQKVDG
jgi:hypothetical protein